MSTLIFNPDAHVEDTSVDGDAMHIIGSPGASWATFQAGAGTHSDDSDTTIHPRMGAVSTTNRWNRFDRAFLLFDTRDLTAAASIDSATLEIVVTSTVDVFSASVSLVTTNPAADDDIVNADYTAHFPSPPVKQALDKTMASFTADSSTYNVYTLNATGESKISKTGITKFGLAVTEEMEDDEPSWISNGESRLIVASAEETLSGDKRPKLVVVFTLPFTPKVIMF